MEDYQCVVAAEGVLAMWMATMPPPQPTAVDTRAERETRPIAPAPVVRTGRGQIIVGAVVGAVGFGGKIASSALFSRDLASSHGGDPQVPPWLVVSLLSIAYNPLLGAGLSLVGSGSFRRGQWAADQDLFRGGTIERPRSRTSLGLVLLVGGIAIWGGTRLGATRCASALCQVVVLEGGYYASLPLTGVGLPLAMWSTGYDKYRARWTGVASELRVAPAARRDRLGLTVSGRF